MPPYLSLYVPTYILPSIYGYPVSLDVHVAANGMWQCSACGHYPPGKAAAAGAPTYCLAALQAAHADKQESNAAEILRC